ncbi:MAG: 50S ribosomal protein L20 [Clostridia bacterium]|nr:50S ribosomal protein L20 [Clostridia bacterium]
MRIKNGVHAIKKRNKILKKAKGYFGGKSTQFKAAKEQVMRSGNYAYIGRRLKKRDMRSLWIARINAACRQNEISYSVFMHGLKVANIDLNRKVLADMAVNDSASFSSLVETAKKAISK